MQEPSSTIMDTRVSSYCNKFRKVNNNVSGMTISFKLVISAGQSHENYLYSILNIKQVFIINKSLIYHDLEGSVLTHSRIMFPFLILVTFSELTLYLINSRRVYK